MDILYDIPDWEGKYAITKNGQVWSYLSHSWMQQRYSPYGYLQVRLSNKSHRQWNSIHRLLAKTFIPNPENKPTVDHINRIKDDNRLENLRWATRKEQVYNQTLDTFVRNEHTVECRDKNDHSILIASFANCCEAAELMFNEHSKNSLINRCAQGKKPSAYGYWWKFID